MSNGQENADHEVYENSMKKQKTNDGVESTVIKDRKASRQSAKELAFTRKNQRPGGEMIFEAKALWEEGRQAVSDNNKAERDRIVKELFVLCKNQLCELIFKHDSSRVVQFMIKEGKDEQRLLILNELQGSLFDLAFSKYGRFVLTKFLKYVASSRNAIRQAFLKTPHSMKKLVLSREASEILEELFTQYSNTAQKDEMLGNLCGPEYILFSKERKLPQSIISRVFEIAQNSINKGTFGYSSLIHYALLDIIKTGIEDAEESKSRKQANEILEILKDQLVHILHLKYGSAVVLQLLPFTSIKLRKSFVKELKPVLAKVVTDDYGHLVLLATLDITDDTVLTGKHIISDLRPLLGDLFASSNGKKVLQYLLTKSFASKCFNVDLVKTFDEIYNRSKALGNTKKERAIRSQELFEVIQDPLATFFEKEIPRNEDSLLRIIDDTASSLILSESLNFTCQESGQQIFSLVFAQIAVMLSEDPKLLQTDKALSLFLTRVLTKSECHKKYCSIASQLFPIESYKFLVFTESINAKYGLKLASFLLKHAPDNQKELVLKQLKASADVKTAMKTLVSIKEKITQELDFDWISHLEKILS